MWHKVVLPCAILRVEVYLDAGEEGRLKKSDLLTRPESKDLLQRARN